MARRGCVDTPCSLGPPSTITTRAPSLDCNVSIGDDVSRRPSPVPVIRKAIRFWNDVSSVALAHNCPTSTLRPSV